MKAGLLSWLLPALTLAGQAATLQTLDGRLLQGKIEFDTTGLLLFWPPGAPPIPVALTNLLRVDFSNTNNPAIHPRLKPLVADEDRGALPVPWENTDIG